jgi:hypothetical protein
MSITPCFDYLSIRAVSNAEYPCTHCFLVERFVILRGNFFFFFEPATNSVCAWRILKLCRMASCAVTNWSCAHVNFDKLEFTLAMPKKWHQFQINQWPWRERYRQLTLSFLGVHTKFPQWGCTNAFLKCANKHYAANYMVSTHKIRVRSCPSNHNTGHLHSQWFPAHCCLFELISTAPQHVWGHIRLGLPYRF